MKLTQKLLGYLNRVFDKGPERVLALRFRYDGAMTWSIVDGVLQTSVSGGSGAPLSLSLDGRTIAELAALIASQPGYSVPFVDVSGVPGLKATVLIDGSGDQDESNGDHLYAYTSALWAFLEAQASDLKLAREAIDEALLQMAASTASGDWVDEHGAFYAVPRRSSGEADAAYAARIVAEVGRARGTRTAMGEAVRRAVSADSAMVTDYDNLTVAGDGTTSYGLFDVAAVIDVNVDLTAAQIDSNTRAVIEAMRDAGTFLRQLRYVMKSNLLLRVGATLTVGCDVTVSFTPIARVLDGSWLLDGSHALDGVESASAIDQLSHRGWTTI